MFRDKKSGKYGSVDEYIRSFPEHIREKLMEMRDVIRKQAPHARGKISYQIPTFFLNGNLVHFAAHSNHIGFYPTSSGLRAFKSELTKYRHAKGSVQFPLEEPLPAGLIRKIVKFRVGENMKKEKERYAGPAHSSRR